MKILSIENNGEFLECYYSHDLNGKLYEGRIDGNNKISTEEELINKLREIKESIDNIKEESEKSKMEKKTYDSKEIKNIEKKVNGKV